MDDNINFKQICINKGVLYGLNIYNQLYYGSNYKTPNWQLINGITDNTITYVDIDNNIAVALTSNYIYYSDTGLLNPTWVMLSSYLPQIAINNGRLCGCDSNGVWFNTNYKTSNWTSIKTNLPTSLTYIDFEDNLIVGVNSLGHYFYADNDITNPLWVKTPETPILFFKQISISNGQLYATSLNNETYYSDNYKSPNWVKVNTGLKQVSFWSQSNIVEITNIRDNEIFFDRTLVQYPQLENNIFVEFILPYQPFEIQYVNFSSDGTILSTTFENNTTLVFNGKTFNIMIPYIVKANKINITLIAGYRWVRVWKTQYVFNNTNNSMTITTNLNNNTLNLNNFPIKLTLAYDSIKQRFAILNATNMINSFNFYYLQPVMIAGVFTYIQKILNINGTYYIYFTDTNLINLSGITNIDVLFSPINTNHYEYNTQTKIRYNFGFNILNYDSLVGTQINIIRYILKNDKLIFIQKYIGDSPIVFEYGKTIKENEINNGITDGYNSLYFYNYRCLDSDGFITNFDTHINNYHLLIETWDDFEKVHLVQILGSNKLKMYTDIKVTGLTLYLDRIIPIKLNKNGEFTYSNPTIIESKTLLDINNNIVNIISQYDIRLNFSPVIIQQNPLIFKHNFTFVGTNIIDPLMYNKVYIEEPTSTSFAYDFAYDNSTQLYSIISPNKILFDIKTIYTTRINYLQSAQKQNQNKKNKLLDDITLDTTISSSTKIELLTQNINISKINPTDNKYFYRLADGSHNFYFNTLDNYDIFYIFQKILDINATNNILTLTEPIDIDTLENSQDYFTTQIYTENIINTTNIFDNKKLFNDVQQLKIFLLSQSKIDDSFILYYNFKPWGNWSLLSGIASNSKLSNLVKNVYLKWENGSVKQISTSTTFTYTYLTNDEITRYTQFLTAINTSSINLSYYNNLTSLNTLIFTQLPKWLEHPGFFLDVMGCVNTFLQFNNSYFKFDGINFIPIIGNCTYIVVNGINEPAAYITNELICSSTQVYRPNLVYVQTQISNWINKTVPTITDSQNSVNINYLFRQLKIIGEQLKDFMITLNEPLKTTQTNDYNNALKYLINKIWENNSDNDRLNILNKNYSDIMKTVLTYNTSNKIYSSFNYLDNLSLEYTGLNTLNYYINFNNIVTTEYAIQNLTLYEPNLLKPLIIQESLEIKPLYPYMINFKTSEINANITYNIHFITGDNIATDVIISNPVLYPDQLNFYSEHDITTDDFIVIEEKNNYLIKQSEFLGYAYKINIRSNYINPAPITTYVDEVRFRNYNLTIVEKISLDELLILVPFELNEKILLANLIFGDSIELLTKNSIKNIKLLNNKQYIEFYSLNFNYNSASYAAYNTILKTNLNTYFLNSEVVSNNRLFFIEGNPIDSMEVIISSFIFPFPVSTVDMTMYNFNLTPFLTETNYNPIYRNYIMPLDFNLELSTDTNTLINITPFKVNTLGDNNLQLQFSIADTQLILNNKQSKITYTKKIGESLTNKITYLEAQNEFLYYFNFILPKTTNPTNTTIYLYNYLINDINIPLGIYEPTMNPETKTSLYINQTNNQTYFTTSTKFTFDNIKTYYKFIQKNSWTIDSYTQSNNRMEITLPTDLILNMGSKYYYKINDTPIDKSTFIFNSQTNKLSFEWPTLPTITQVILKQYYIESDLQTIFIPLLNRKYIVYIEYSYQYKPEDNFYIMPYTGNGGEFDKYLYQICFPGYAGHNPGYNGKYSGDPITLYSNGIKYDCKILDEYSNGSNYYIISSKQMLNVSASYTYHLRDNIMQPVLSIVFWQETFQFANIYSQIATNYIYLFMNDSVQKYTPRYSTFNNKNDYIDYITKPSKYYLISYDKYEVNNLYNNNNFVQNDTMKQQITYDQQQIIQIEKPILNDFTKIFEFIRLYFNEQMIEELNENVFNINYYLYLTEEKRKQFDAMTKIRFNVDKWELYMPLIFWFSNKAGSSIPLVALPYTELALKYKLNDISVLLKNDLSGSYIFSKIPQVKINLISDFILLDTMERKLFGSYAHEYIIERYLTCPNNFINSETQVLVKNFSGLIKDIHLISKPINSTTTYYANIITNYDSRYDHYLTAVSYYLLYIQTNLYMSDEQRAYALEIEILKKTNLEFTNYLNASDKSSYARIVRLIDSFSGWSIWDTNYELLKYLMYFEDKYLTQLTDSRKNYVESIYLKYQYKNNVIIDEISPVEAITIKANGEELFTERDWSYFTNVVPTQKYKNSLPTGYYSYTFSLYPLDDQPSGHLNFSNFDDIVIKVRSNALVNTNAYVLETVVKEYNIIRIMSGLGSLAWI